MPNAMTPEHRKAAIARLRAGERIFLSGAALGCILVIGAVQVGNSGHRSFFSDGTIAAVSVGAGLVITSVIAFRAFRAQRRTLENDVDKGFRPLN
jgi:hypothetical protein